MLLAEQISEQGIALWIGGLGSAILGVYALFRRTKRQEDSADNQANATFWQKQAEEQRKGDLEYRQKVDSKLAELFNDYRALEKDHLACREEHAQARGEIAVMRQQIADLKARLTQGAT